MGTQTVLKFSLSFPVHQLTPHHQDSYASCPCHLRVQSQDRFGQKGSERSAGSAACWYPGPIGQSSSRRRNWRETGEVRPRQSDWEELRWVFRYCCSRSSSRFASSTPAEAAARRDWEGLARQHSGELRRTGTEEVERPRGGRSLTWFWPG